MIILQMFTFFPDIDECMSFVSPCDDNAICGNREGGFDCVCNTGFQGDGFTCVGQSLYIYFNFFFINYPAYRSNNIIKTKSYNCGLIIK